MTASQSPALIWEISDESRVDRNLVGVHIPGRDELGNPETTCHLITTDQARVLAERLLEVVKLIEEQPKE